MKQAHRITKVGRSSLMSDPKASIVTLVVIVGLVVGAGVYLKFASHAATTASTSLPPGILFDGDFETPVAAGHLDPWATSIGSGSGVQCQNWGAPTTTNHYPGDLYLDDGSSTSPTQGDPPSSQTPGNHFTDGSVALVPPGAGSWSGRITLPITPSSTPTSTGGSVIHYRTYCTLHSVPTAAPGDLGSDKYYGLMFYIPPGESLANNDFSGNNIWEFHFNAVWGAPVAWELHTGGTSNVNGTGSSVVLALETGACNPASSASPGCQYRSNAGNPRTPNPTNTNPTVSNPQFLPSEYAIPPNQLKYGVWNELVMKVHWASDTTGSIQSWYKDTSTSTWTPSASISGIPTIQWDVNAGCTPGSTTPGNCGFPTRELLEQYTDPVSSPFSMNFDNQIVGTSLTAVEAMMPTAGSPPPPSVPGDLNGDGHVTVADLAYLLSKWATTDATADIDKNGSVGVGDLAILLSHWGA